MDGVQSIFPTTPVGKIQAHEPSVLDIGPNDRLRHAAPSEAGEKELVPRRLIADAPGIEADDAEIPTPSRRLFGEDKLDEIACLRWRRFARLGERMTWGSHWDELDTFYVDAAKSCHIHVQLASHADACVAVSERVLDAAEGLHQKSDRHGWELGFEFAK